MPSLPPIPIPVNETARNIAVGALAPEDGSHSKVFHEITEIVRDAFGTEIALVTMIDAENSVHLAHSGTDIGAIPKDLSICANALVGREPLVIRDTLADPRWRNQTFAVNPPYVRFYAGVPILLSSGFAVGTVCAIGLKPRPAGNVGPMSLLTRLAQLVANILELPLEAARDRVANYEKAQKTAQEEFLSLVSHELRTPLSGIVGLSENLTIENDDENNLVEALNHSARHLSDIVDNILTFTELRSGSMMLDESRFPVNELVEATVRLFQPLAGSRGKSLAATPDPTGPVMTADAVKLQLALSCLLSNVVLHGGKKASVAVTRSPSNHLVLNVIDNGVGISENRIDAVMDAFVTGQKVTSRAADGIGLGLPLTRRLVELQGGMLQLSNAADHFSARIILPSWRIAEG